MRSDRGAVFGAARRDGVWPRVYRPTRGYRLFLGALGAVAIAGGLAAAGLSLRDAGGPFWIGVAIGVAFVLLGLFLFAALGAERVRLFEDGTVEFSELGRGQTRLRPAEISGVRLLENQGIQYLFFHFRAQDRKPFRVGLICERDEHFDRWLAAFPDLDAVEREAAEARLLDDPALGRVPSERLRAISRARLLARGLSVVAWVTAGVAWLRPRPYAPLMAALAVIPAISIALLLASRGALSVDEQKSDPRPSVLVPIMIPGFALMLRAMLDFTLLDERPLLLLSAPVALALAGLLLVGDRQLRTRWFMAPLAFLFVAPLAWGALAEGNVLLDRSPAERFRARVVEKQISSDKTRSPELKLAAFGPVAAGEVVRVSRRDYEATTIGDEVCATVRAGRIGVRWLIVERCE